MQKERRKFVRVPVLMKVINESKEYDFGFSYAKDLSAGGMSLDTKVILNRKVNLKEGDTLKLKFKIPGRKLYISGLGRIVRIDKGRDDNIVIGVEFLNLDEAFRVEIEDFVNQTAKGSLRLE